MRSAVRIFTLSVSTVILLLIAVAPWHPFMASAGVIYFEVCPDIFRGAWFISDQWYVVSLEFEPIRYFDSPEFWHYGASLP